MALAAVEPVRGLRQLLVSKGFTKLIGPVEEWCNENGAAFLWELQQNSADLAAALRLEGAEHSRLVAAFEEVAQLHRARTQPAVPLVLRASSVELAHQAAPQPQAAPARTVSANFIRTFTSPVTVPEYQTAGHRLSTAYVPLRAWPVRVPASSTVRSTAGEVQEDVNDAEGGQDLDDESYLKTKKKPEWYYSAFRREHVPENILRRRIPSPAELQNPFEQEMLQARVDRMSSPWLLQGKHSFEAVRSQLMQQHGEQLRTKLSGVLLGSLNFKPAPVSKEVQARFLGCMRETGITSATPAFHGSAAENYSSIYEKGLLIPGKKTGVKVVHGSAHGVGIYTAQIHKPSLSAGFCSEPRMLVCGVLDDAMPAMSTERVGRLSVTAKSEVIKHVGDAMVVFDEARVVPLFEASGEELRGHTWGAPAPAPVGPGAVPLAAAVGPRGLPPRWPQAVQAPQAALFVPAGKGKVYHIPSRTTAWMPAKPHEDSHDMWVKQKRIYEHKVRDLGRKQLRAAKSEATGHED